MRCVCWRIEFHGIEYLHKQNIGRATFLILEKIDKTLDGMNGMRTIQTPHQDVVVFVSEFAGFLGVYLVTV